MTSDGDDGKIKNWCVKAALLRADAVCCFVNTGYRQDTPTPACDISNGWQNAVQSRYCTRARWFDEAQRLRKSGEI
jgi:hypothetical protein